MGKAILFSRVSTQGQQLDSQELAVYNQARADGFKDEDMIAISHKESAIQLKLAERKGLQDLFEYIDNDSKHEIDCVYVFEISRISRQPDQVYQVRNYLQEHRVQLVIVKPFIRLFDVDNEYKVSEMGNILLAVYVGVAEAGMQTKKDRFKRAKQYLKQQQCYIGGKILFGYKVGKNKKFEINEEEANIVRRIFAMYNSGHYSGKQIATIMYDEGIFGNIARGKSKETRIDKLLRNEHYYNGVGYPPIISEEDYQKAKELRAKYKCKNRYSYEGNIYLGSRLMFSEVNNLMFQVRKKDIAYQQRESNMCINLNTMDSLILYVTNLAYLHHFSSDYDKLIQSYLETLNQIEKRLNNYKKQDADISKKIDRVEERYIYGSITKDKLEELESKLLKERDEIKKKQANDLNEQSRIKAEYDNIVKPNRKGKPIDIYKQPKEEQLKMVRNEIEKIVIRKGKNFVYVKFFYKNPLMTMIDLYEVHAKKKQKFYRHLPHVIEKEVVDIPIIKSYERLP